MRRMMYILILFLFYININAQEINNINMEIFIDNNGTAHVNEVWQVDINNGTEGYKPYYNMGESKISDYTVSMNGDEFTYENWSNKTTFDDKAYKNSIINIEDGVELVWGISDYGINTYELKYKISNFVSKLDDADMIYWTLMPHDFEQRIGKVKITISADFSIPDDIDVWGYGNYGGLAYVSDGKIHLEKENLKEEEYMTILAKFPLNTFQTTNSLNNNFEHYLNMAQENAEEYKVPILKRIFQSIWSFIGPLIPITLGALVLIASKNSQKPFFSRNKLRLKELNYFRDIPFKDDLLRANFVASGYNIAKTETNIIGALILKFIKLELIKINTDKKKNLTIINEDTSGLSDNEVKLFEMIKSAATNNVLSQKDFDKYAKKNYSKVKSWLNNILSDEKKELVKENLLEREKYKFYDTPQLFEKGKELGGLYMFLKNLSNIHEKKSVEVHLWEYYLMYAQIFGIAKQVSKELKNLYPAVITDEVVNNYMFINAISYSTVRTANSAYQNAQNYSSGGGGFSSGGGGGGSFGGGGSGGGGFR